MNCEEFWEKAAEFVGGRHELPLEIKEHIAACSQCEREFNHMRKGLINLRKEIIQEQPAILWHEMKKNISKNINIPSKTWNFTDIWKFVLAPTSVAIALFFAFFFYKLDKKTEFFLNFYDATLLVSDAQLEDVLLHNNVLTSNDKYDTELNSAIFSGITDDISIIIIKNNDIS